MKEAVVHHHHREKFIAWIISCGIFMENFDSTIINTAIPQMSHSSSVHPLTLRVAITSYLFSLLLFMPISGFLADKFGTKRIFISAIIIFSIGSLLCGLSSTLGLLIGSRMIQGIGGAMMVPTGRLIIIKSFPLSKVLPAMANMATIAQLGPVLGPVAGGFLVHYLTWHWIFLVNIPIGVVGVWLAHRFIPDSHGVETPAFDFTEFLIFGMSLVAINVFLSFSDTTIMPQSFANVSLLLGIVGVIGYVLYARTKTNPMISWRPFRIRTFSTVVMGSTWIRITANSFPFILPLLLQLNFGYNAFQSGLFVLPFGLGLIGAKFFIWTLLEAIGYRRVLMINPCAITVITLAFAYLTPNTPFVLILGLCFLSGMSCSVQFSAIQTLTFADIPEQDKSKATSLAAIMQQMGINLSICVTAFLLAFFNEGGAKIINLSAFHLSFICLALVAVSSILIFWHVPSEAGQGYFK